MKKHFPPTFKLLRRRMNPPKNYLNIWSITTSSDPGIWSFRLKRRFNNSTSKTGSLSALQALPIISVQNCNLWSWSTGFISLAWKPITFKQRTEAYEIQKVYNFYCIPNYLPFQLIINPNFSSNPAYLQMIAMVIITSIADGNRRFSNWLAKHTNQAHTI